MSLVVNKRLIKTLVICLLASGVLGCQSTCQHNRCCNHRQPVANPQVTTGGLYASLKTLSIPQNGLTLAAAVDQSLRPAFRQGVQPGVTLVSTPMPFQVSKSQKIEPTINAKKLVENATAAYQAAATRPGVDVSTLLTAMTSDVKAGNTLVGVEPWFQETMADIFTSDIGKEILLEKPKDGVLTDRQEQLSVIADQVANYASTDRKVLKLEDRVINALVKLRSADAVDLMNSETIKKLSDDKLTQAAIAALVKNKKSDFSESQTGELTEKETFIAQVLQEIVNGTEVDAAPLQAEQPAAGPAAADRSQTPTVSPGVANASPPSQLDGLVVVLKRTGSKTILVPLQLVMATPVGDIQLQDQDRIEVTAFTQTTMAQRQVQNGNYAVSGFGAETVAKSPAKTLQALSTQVMGTDAGRVANLIAVDIAGSNQQYWIPASGGIFESLAGPDMVAARLSAGDSINVGALQLLPMVQASRVQQRIENLEQEIKQCLHDELKTSVQKSPVSQGIYNSARNSLRSIGIPLN